ncbi:glutathione S-transferase [Sphingomonas colocasiae]|uniref:Glutathione S-transferase n=2 Tax=Sphingomonas colocasiae TaxID=1848973 RepID=A0ABS7PM84_9SPHN|nr:glutathione S-transferase [Sphingomonas colocasiae]
MTRPILYSFRRCPYAMRARLALLVSDTICEIREVKLVAKPAEMVSVSPKATVPVLVLPDGRVIDESLDIMRWALGRNDPEGWLARGDEALIAANDGPFKHHLDRYKYPDRHASDPAQHRHAALELLHVLEARLASQPCLRGDAPGLADAAIMPFVRQFAQTDRAWFDARPLPHLQAWLERRLAAPLFSAAMVRLQPWQAGDAPILFSDRESQFLS